MRTPFLAALAIALLCPAAPSRAQDKTELKAFEVYRSQTLTADKAREAIGTQLANYQRLRADGGKGALKNAERVRAQIEEKIKTLGEFPFVRLHYAEYITSSERTAYALLDVVDAKDAAVRLPFRAAPTGSLPDPAGLLASWKGYNDLGKSLLREGKLSTDHNDCPAHFCLWGSPTPELADYERRFTDGAAKNWLPLVELATKDADPDRRATALFVLTYAKDSKAVVETVTGALLDPAEEVRSAALQILSDVALYRKEVFLEVQKIIPALDDPFTANRAKALSVLVGLSNNPTYKPFVLSKGTPYLLGLLRLSEPSNHDLAFALLSMLAKEPFGRRDYKSWETWVAAQASTPAVPGAQPSSR